MEFYAYPSRALPSSSSVSNFSIGDLVERVKYCFSFAVSTIVGNVFSAIFTFFFALVGTLLGAMTGALIGQETESGFVRGAAVGAISGAVFSLEVFESSLLLWHSDESGIGCLLYLIDVIASLLSGRLVRERIGPAMLSAVQSQMGAIDTAYDEFPNIFDVGGAKGLPGDSVEKIPKIVITNDNDVDNSGERVSCSVCLQDFQRGETARCLPQCHHMFHLPCIDTWLLRHGSCPLCRRDLLKVLTQGDDEILSAEEVPTIDLLKKIGFSDAILERFFRPFFGGIFFDRELETTSRLFNFIFKCLALGDNTLPAKGIAAIPEQLAAKLPSNSILFNTRVVSIDSGSDSSTKIRVTLQNGEMLESEFGVILAVEEPEAVKLLAGEKTGEVRQPVRSTVCLYFSADQGKVPVQDPVLLLNGSGKGIVNNMFFATNVAPSYAPVGKALVSVTLVGIYGDVADEDLVDQVVKELSGWFGESVVGSWSYLRMYRIGFAQPNQCPPTNLKKNPKIKPGLYICGDYVTSATFDGALVSGKIAAETLLQDRALVNV
ncbi:hypothetical protein KY290_014936 [Solanum tuberosum]|uniref:RING-type domain-containing protein n=2 Tax=Solanum tuberosum TaxID=4113 RepID=A0ABQ7VT22_SOLTU|nr:hypothetical protein KY285_014375 [Solanum tuberosum]KAH0770955.1 hypothetical protein KY290_014936 [Solanum tuberosum]